MEKSKTRKRKRLSRGILTVLVLLEKHGPCQIKDIAHFSEIKRVDLFQYAKRGMEYGLVWRTKVGVKCLFEPCSNWIELVCAKDHSVKAATQPPKAPGPTSVFDLGDKVRKIHFAKSC